MLNSETVFWLIVARQWPENSLISFKKQFSAKFWGVNGLKIMTEHATYYEKADHCTFPLFEKQQIIIVASEMEWFLYVLMTSCSTSVAWSSIKLKLRKWTFIWRKGGRKDGEMCFTKIVWIIIIKVKTTSTHLQVSCKLFLFWSLISFNSFYKNVFGRTPPPPLLPFMA